MCVLKRTEQLVVNDVFKLVSEMCLPFCMRGARNHLKPGVIWLSIARSCHEKKYS